jgi:hypothetical protein
MRVTQFSSVDPKDWPKVRQPFPNSSLHLPHGKTIPSGLLRSHLGVLKMFIKLNKIIFFYQELETISRYHDMVWFDYAIECNTAAKIFRTNL